MSILSQAPLSGHHPWPSLFDFGATAAPQGQGFGKPWKIGVVLDGLSLLMGRFQGL